MARKRASMREGPLAELFRATEAAQRAQGEQQPDPSSEVTEVTPPETEAPTQLPLEPEQPTAAEPFVAPETRGPIEFEATVEHVYDFETERPEPAERRPEPVERRSEPSPQSPPPTPVLRAEPVAPRTEAQDGAQAREHA